MSETNVASSDAPNVHAEGRIAPSGKVGEIDPTVKVYLGYPGEGDYRGYLSDMHHVGGQPYYVNWGVSSGARAHGIKIVNAVPRISPDPNNAKYVCAGDTVRIETTETRGGSSNRISAGDIGYMQYTDGDGDSEHWIVEVVYEDERHNWVNRPDGWEVVLGTDIVRFVNVKQTAAKWDDKPAGTKVFLCRDPSSGYKYLSVRPADGGSKFNDYAQIDWNASKASA